MLNGYAVEAHALCAMSSPDVGCVGARFDEKLRAAAADHKQHLTWALAKEKESLLREQERSMKSIEAGKEAVVDAVRKEFAAKLAQKETLCEEREAEVDRLPHRAAHLQSPVRNSRRFR
eukprot:791341-Rhodomonas_salina.5